MRKVANPTIESVRVDPPALVGRRVLGQRWTELGYFHWPYDPAVVQRLLPRGVTVDTFAGDAWIGLIPFEMRDVRLGGAPPVPWLGQFIEVNVRTYVIDARGRRAVWFFSLDVPRAVIVAVARSVFALPYCWADCEHRVEADRHEYRVLRRWPRPSGAQATIGYTVGDRIADADIDELDHFLTARWGLLTTRRSRVLYGGVHHQPWPLHHVHDVRIEQNVIEAAGLPSPVGPPRALCSPGVDVEVAWLRAVRPGPALGERW